MVTEGEIIRVLGEPGTFDGVEEGAQVSYSVRGLRMDDRGRVGCFVKRPGEDQRSKK